MWNLRSRRHRRATIRQQPAASTPQMAESNQPPPPIRQITEATPSAVTRLAPLSAAVQTPELAEAAPVVPLSRRQAQRFEPTAELPSPSAEPSPQSAQLVRPQSDETGQLTAVDPTPQETPPLTRPRTPSSVPPVAVAVSATEGETPGPLPTLDTQMAPSRTALQRAEQGLSGGGDSINLDQGREAPPSPVSIASASARRAEATQDQQAGPSIAPSPGARIPRARSASKSAGHHTSARRNCRSPNEWPLACWRRWKSMRRRADSGVWRRSSSRSRPRSLDSRRWIWVPRGLPRVRGSGPRPVGDSRRSGKGCRRRRFRPPDPVVLNRPCSRPPK